jgi:hypothetical protein
MVNTMRTTRMIALAAVLAWFASAELCAEPSPEPPTDVICHRDSGSANFHVSSGPAGTDVRITGAGGGYGGGATLTFGSGAVTPKMKFRFPSLRTLETFTLTAGKRSFQGRLGWGAGKSTVWFDKNGRPVANAALAAVTLVMEVNKAGDVEVRVSASRDVDLGKYVRFDWILQPEGERLGKGGEVKD